MGDLYSVPLRVTHVDDDVKWVSSRSCQTCLQECHIELQALRPIFLFLTTANISSVMHTSTQRLAGRKKVK